MLKPGTAVDNTDDANIVASGVTNASGAFTIAFLLPGTYEIRATPPAGTVYRATLLTGGLTITDGVDVTGKIVVLGR